LRRAFVGESAGASLSQPRVYAPRVHAVVKASAAVAVIAMFGGFATRRASSVVVPAHAAGSSTVSASPKSAGSSAPRLCPSGQLALAPTAPCVALPAEPDESHASRERTLARAPSTAELSLIERTPRVERLPERSEDWRLYQLPVEPPEGAAIAMLDDAPGWVRLPGSRGAAVQLMTLEGQRGDAEVVAVGQLRGITVVTRHRVERADGAREFLVFHGRLERPGPSVTVGARLGTLAVVGFLAGARGDATLELSLRELREPLASPLSTLTGLESEALGFVVDPRNAFPLRP